MDYYCKATALEIEILGIDINVKYGIKVVESDDYINFAISDYDIKYL